MSIASPEDETDQDPRLSMVDEALVAGTIANTNGLLVIIAKLVARGILDKDDLKAFSDSYSKPLDHLGMRENELVSQMQDQMESTLAELMRFLSERNRGGGSAPSHRTPVRSYIPSTQARVARMANQPRNRVPQASRTGPTRHSGAPRCVRRPATSLPDCCVIG